MVCIICIARLSPQIASNCIFALTLYVILRRVLRNFAFCDMTQVHNGNNLLHRFCVVFRLAHKDALKTTHQLFLNTLRMESSGLKSAK